MPLQIKPGSVQKIGGTVQLDGKGTGQGLKIPGTQPVQPTTQPKVIEPVAPAPPLPSPPTVPTFGPAAGVTAQAVVDSIDDAAQRVSYLEDVVESLQQRLEEQEQLQSPPIVLPPLAEQRTMVGKSWLTPQRLLIGGAALLIGAGVVYYYRRTRKPKKRRRKRR
jgi:hypothetical protein